VPNTTSEKIRLIVLHTHRRSDTTVKSRGGFVQNHLNTLSPYLIYTKLITAQQLLPKFYICSFYNFTFYDFYNFIFRPGYKL